MVDTSHRQVLIGVGVFVVALIAVVVRTPTPDIFLVDSDAGHQLAGAQQIEFGEHPFVDFRSTYGPLTFYASYAAQRIGGGTIAAELLLCALAYSVAFLLIFRCTDAMGGTFIALGCTAVWQSRRLPRFYKYYIFLGTALVMICLLRYIRRPGRTRLALLAGAIVIAGLYRPDQGIYAFVRRGVRDIDRAAIGDSGVGGIAGDDPRRGVAVADLSDRAGWGDGLPSGFNVGHGAHARGFRCRSRTWIFLNRWERRGICRRSGTASGGRSR